MEQEQGVEVTAPRTEETNHEDVEESEEDETQVETPGGMKDKRAVRRICVTSLHSKK